MGKKAIKIGKYTFWIYKDYVINSQDLNKPSVNGKRHKNIFRWESKYNAPVSGKLNESDYPIEIVMRAFIQLFPEEEKYIEEYNKMFGKKESKVNINSSNSNDILVKALRQQAELYAAALKQQAEMNRVNIENIISLVTNNESPTNTEEIVEEIDVPTDTEEEITDETPDKYEIKEEETIVKQNLEEDYDDEDVE